MTRKRVSQATQDAVLLKSKRRCCICFGLQGDIDLKPGQIAHLDKNNQNDAEENLAFLCLTHHDQYDSITRQSKNFTIGEVKHYRVRLYEKLSEQFDNLTFFENKDNAIDDSIPGLYIRTGTPHSAEIQITRLLDGRYHVSADAVWVSPYHGGAHLGQIEFSSDLKESTIEYIDFSDFSDDRPNYKLMLIFKNNNDLIAIEENAEWATFLGMNVRLAGDYIKSS